MQIIWCAVITVSIGMQSYAHEITKPEVEDVTEQHIRQKAHNALYAALYSQRDVVTHEYCESRLKALAVRTIKPYADYSEDYNRERKQGWIILASLGKRCLIAKNYKGWDEPALDPGFGKLQKHSQFYDFVWLESGIVFLKRLNGERNNSLRVEYCNSLHGIETSIYVSEPDSTLNALEYKLNVNGNFEKMNYLTEVEKLRYSSMCRLICPSCTIL
jgi:hypothetical protein